MAEPFAVKDCALIAIGTGERAQNLRELRDRLLNTHPACIYHHFWGGLLRPRFDDPEYQNDFAGWAWHGLRDGHLAERLALVDPSQLADLEDLRRELVELIEERLEESEFIPWAKTSQQFYFMRSQIVVFDTRIRVDDPETLVELLPRLSVGSVFYHFIDGKRRTPSKRDDFSEWLLGFGDVYSGLVQRLSAIDTYFSSLTELRRELEIMFASSMSRGKP
jgi:hypothetical protein